MTRAMINAFWEWFPGVVAGGLPFIAFLLAVSVGGEASPERTIEAARHMDLGLITHCLVLAIVTSSVTVISSFSRIFGGQIPNFAREGRGPILIVMGAIFIVIYSSVLYAFAEARVAHGPILAMAIVGAVGALMVSLYMEVAIARLQVLASHPARG